MRAGRPTPARRNSLSARSRPRAHFARLDGSRQEIGDCPRERADILRGTRPHVTQNLRNGSRRGPQDRNTRGHRLDKHPPNCSFQVGVVREGSTRRSIPRYASGIDFFGCFGSIPPALSTASTPAASPARGPSPTIRKRRREIAVPRLPVGDPRSPSRGPAGRHSRSRRIRQLLPRGNKREPPDVRSPGNMSNRSGKPAAAQNADGLMKQGRRAAMARMRIPPAPAGCPAGRANATAEDSRHPTSGRSAMYGTPIAGGGLRRRAMRSTCVVSQKFSSVRTWMTSGTGSTPPSASKERNTTLFGDFPARRPTTVR